MDNVSYNKQKVQEFYTKIYNEDSRLSDDCPRNRQVEKRMKEKILSRWIQPGSRVCEIGAGKGVWVEWLLSHGCEVRAFDIVEEHVTAMNERFYGKDNWHGASVMDILDEDDALRYGYVYDLVLLSGPMYHVGNIDDRLTILHNCKRFMNQRTIIAIDWLSQMNALAESILNPDCKNNLTIDERLMIHPADDNIFSYSNLMLMKDMLTDAGFSHIISHPLDGFSRLVRSDLSRLSDEKFEEWLRLSERISDLEQFCAISEHNLTIARKF